MPSHDLSDSARLIDVCLTLLENPQQLYLRCDDDQRRLLNQAIFHGLYIEEDQITDHDLKQPFAHLHRVQASRHLVQSDKPDPGAPVTQFQNASRAVSHTGDGPAAIQPLEALLQGIDLATGSNKPPKVEMRGFEPLAPSMRTRCATGLRYIPWDSARLANLKGARASPGGL